MKDHYGVLDGGADHEDQLTAQVTADRDALLVQSDVSKQASPSEHQHAEGAQALARLLASYGAVLDSIKVKPPIIFLFPRTVPRNWLGRRFPLPYANFIASILAIRHVAARVDILLRRGRRISVIR